jgi:hypothetical protein
MADLFPASNGHTRNGKPHGRIVQTYNYHDETRNLLFQVCRMEPKDFRQRKPDGNGGWTWSTKGVRRVLYRLPELLAADPGQPVFVVEGEKDADRLATLRLIATTNPGGAGKWQEEFSEFLPQRRVVILPDNDQTGRKHASDVARSVRRVVESVKVVELPGLPDKGDVSDFLNAGGTVEHLLRLVDAAPEWTPTAAPEQSPPIIGNRDKWPDPLDDRAYYGLAGEIVRAIEPHSEADPVALLVQLLIAVGNCIGRTAHFVAESQRHHLNLFCVLVGVTSKGRKGSAWSHILRLFDHLNPLWTHDRIRSGLSSGEGLIWNVRDPIIQRQPIKEKGRVVDYQDVEVDPGESDKRLLVVEAEFANTLKVMGREGNTLSAVVRQAWDTGHLRTLTKNNPAKSTDAHISLVGHITRDELRRNMTATEQTNGFGNRFLWLCVQRSKALPEGGRIHQVDFTDLLTRLGNVMHFADTVGQMDRDAEAKRIWAQVYPDLSEGQPGLLGAMLSRAEAQVMRLACLYAVLDHSLIVTVNHLYAALALWDFCDASARYIFGGSLGDRVADDILVALKASPEGLTRTEISDLFHRNRPAGEINRALQLLADHRLARPEPGQTDGRDAERWVAVAQGTK